MGCNKWREGPLPWEVKVCNFKELCKEAKDHCGEELENGFKQDMTMADINDVGRINYVLNNPETIERTLDEFGNPVFASRLSNHKGGKVPQKNILPLTCTKKGGKK